LLAYSRSDPAALCITVTCLARNVATLHAPVG
jgi:hypothetical protein